MAQSPSAGSVMQPKQDQPQCVYQYLGPAEKVFCLEAIMFSLEALAIPHPLTGPLSYHDVTAAAPHRATKLTHERCKLTAHQPLKDMCFAALAPVIRQPCLGAAAGLNHLKWIRCC